MFIFICVHSIFSIAEFGSYSVQSHDALPYIVQHLLKWGGVCSNFSFCCVLLWYLVVFVEDVSRVRIVEDRQKLFRVLQIANVFGYTLLFLDSFFVAVFSDLNKFEVVQHAQGFNTTVFAGLAVIVSSVMAFYGAPVVTLLGGGDRVLDTTPEADRPPSARVMATVMFVTTLCLFGWGILSLIDGIYLMIERTSYWSTEPETQGMNSLDAPLEVLVILEALKLIPTFCALSAFLRCTCALKPRSARKQPLKQQGTPRDSMFQTFDVANSKDSDEESFSPMNIKINQVDDDDAGTYRDTAEHGTYKGSARPEARASFRGGGTAAGPEARGSSRDTRSIVRESKTFSPEAKQVGSEPKKANEGSLKEPLLSKRPNQEQAGSLNSQSDIFARTLSRKTELEASRSTRAARSRKEGTPHADNDDMYNNSMNNSYRQESPNTLRLVDRDDDTVFGTSEHKEPPVRFVQSPLSPVKPFGVSVAAWKQSTPTSPQPPLDMATNQPEGMVVADQPQVSDPAIPDQRILAQMQLLQQQIQHFQRQASQTAGSRLSLAGRPPTRRGHARTGASSTTSYSSHGSDGSSVSVIEGCDHRKVLDIYEQGDQDRRCMVCAIVIPQQSVRIECSCGDVIICMMCNAMYGGDDFASFRFPPPGEPMPPGVILLSRIS